MKKVFDKVFFYVDTIGMPLEMVMLKVHEHGVATNLSAFLDDAISAGWTRGKAIAVVNEAVNSLRESHCNFIL